MAVTAAAPVVVCESVSVAYGRETVLCDVSLEVPRGAFLPFVGPNGAGKTTLLRTILGLIRPSRGRITTDFGPSGAGYVPQEKAIDPLYPVSLRQIVTMGLYRRLGWWRRPSRDQRYTIQQALERFELASHAHKTYAELSGGMRQKALLARAFVGGADVFVMDEPTSELDEGSAADVLNHLVKLSSAEGKTVLLAHHGFDHLAERAQHVCLVEHGRVRLMTAAELIARQSVSPDVALSEITVGGH